MLGVLSGSPLAAERASGHANVIQNLGMRRNQLFARDNTSTTGNRSQFFPTLRVFIGISIPPMRQNVFPDASSGYIARRAFHGVAQMSGMKTWCYPRRLEPNAFRVTAQLLEGLPYLGLARTLNEPRRRGSSWQQTTMVAVIVRRGGANVSLPA